MSADCKTTQQSVKLKNHVSWYKQTSARPGPLAHSHSQGHRRARQDRRTLTEDTLQARVILFRLVMLETHKIG